MGTIRYIFLFYFLFYISFCLTNNNELSPHVTCGFVQDGITQGRFDLQFQISVNTIGANWGGFGNDVLFYEWAIISEHLLPKNILNNGIKCTENLKIIPDIQSWESIKKATSAFNSRLKLKVGDRYRALVRATYYSGHQVIGISDGVTIIHEDVVMENNENNNHENNNNNNSNNNQNKYNEVEEEIQESKAMILKGKLLELYNKNNNKKTNKFSETLPKQAVQGILKRNKQQEHNNNNNNNNNNNKREFETLNNECMIDIQNSCESGTVRVYDQLTEMYGPPVFARTDFLRISQRFRDDDDGDDDDGDDDDDGRDENSNDDDLVPAWVIAPFLVVFLPLLLLSCLIFLLGILFMKVKGIEFDDSNDSVRYDFAEDIGPNGGKRDDLNIGDTNVETRVEFPDTNIRRLSIDHNDAAPDINNANSARSPRRKNPMNSTTSSSFRDYRSVSGNN